MYEIRSEINKCATHILDKHELSNQNGFNVLFKIISYISGMWEINCIIETKKSMD